MNRRGFLGGLFAAGVLAVHMKLGNLAPILEPVKEDRVTVIDIFDGDEHRAYWIDGKGSIHYLSTTKGLFPRPIMFTDRGNLPEGVKVAEPSMMHVRLESLDTEALTRRLYAKES